MRVIRDGVEAMILPDCAKCEVAGKHPHDFNECPIRELYGLYDEDVCDPDCIPGDIQTKLQYME